MSAIAGVISLDGSATDVHVIENMLASLVSAGPDGQRSMHIGDAAFAQALLATTPEALLETQPWTDKDTHCVVVTDSRLDNRTSLADALGLTGRDIDSIGDAELIFAAYQQWGDACPEKLLGDFTFAIWNPITKTLFCARDPLGVRPFYYHHIADKIFAFATTSAALSQILKKPAVLDEGRLADAMTDQLSGYDRVSTFYRDIKRLPPAHSFSLRQNMLSAPHCYWQPLQNPPSPFPDSESQWLEQLATLFVEAVECRLRSHLPISAMLSGGLDSSAVVAVACEKLKRDSQPTLSTFSAISSQNDCPETRAIKLMQSSFDLNSIEIDPEKSPELMQAIATQWSQFDEPFEAMSTLVHAQYLRAKQNNTRIMLDGIDADALLTEADYLQGLARAGKWRTVWREARGSARFWGADANTLVFLRPLISEFLVPLPIRRLVRSLRATFRPTSAHPQALINPAFAQQIDLESRYQTLAGNAAGTQATDALSHRAYSAMAGSYSANGVERYHRLASQYGIEPRHPFMDRRLVEFCAWLPLELRLREGYPKWALRQAMNTRLPENIAWRRGKEHLGWLFTKSLWQHAKTLLTQAPLNAWFDKALVPSFREHYQTNHAPNPPEVNETQLEPLMTLAALNSWLNKQG